MDLGDKNTAFFHKTVAQRVTRNHIHFLRDSNDTMIGTTTCIKSHSAEYFQGIFGCTDLPISPCSVSQLQKVLLFRCNDS